MRRAAFLVFLFSCFLSSLAHAQENDALFKAADEAAQKVIDACMAVSKDDLESGVTKRMRDGTQTSASCLHEKILDVADHVLFTKNKDARDSVAHALVNIAGGEGSVYWSLNNEHDSCLKSPCGTMYTMAGDSAVLDAYARILKDFYRKAAEYDADYHFVVK